MVETEVVVVDELPSLLRTLTGAQLRFVQARLDVTYDREACEALGIAQGTPPSWPNKADVDRAVMLTRIDRILFVREKLSRAASSAVDALHNVAEKGRNERARVAASNSLLNRSGAPEQRGVDVTTAGKAIPSLAEILAGIHASSTDNSSMDDSDDGEEHDFGY